MSKKLEDYVGKLMVPTAKGVKRGDPLDRIYAVVMIVEDQGREYLNAWKCTLTPTGNIIHPAYANARLKPGDPRLFVHKAKYNGSKPTAMFVPDSLYMEFPTK